MKEQTKYWENTYEGYCEGVKFKFKKMNTVEHLNLVTKNVEFEKLDGDKAEYFISKCLKTTLWSRDGSNWNQLVDEEGNSKLPELDEKPSIALDLFYLFKRDVLMPVFTESKTFQSFTRGNEE